jgi:hypothetical protein
MAEPTPTAPSTPVAGKKRAMVDILEDFFVQCLRIATLVDKRNQAEAELFARPSAGTDADAPNLDSQQLLKGMIKRRASPDSMRRALFLDFGCHLVQFAGPMVLKQTCLEKVIPLTKALRAGDITADYFLNVMGRITGCTWQDGMEKKLERLVKLAKAERKAVENPKIIEAFL